MHQCYIIYTNSTLKCELATQTLNYRADSQVDILATSVINQSVIS